MNRSFRNINNVIHYKFMNQRLICFLRIRAICETFNETFKIETHVFPVIFIVRSQTGKFPKPDGFRLDRSKIGYLAKSLKNRSQTSIDSEQLKPER